MKEDKYGDKGVDTSHHASHVPILSLGEKDRRWDLLRERMGVEGIDCLILVGNDIKFGMGMANMRYVTQIGSSMGAFAVFPLVDEPVVWVDHPHMQVPTSRYLFTQGWIKDIRPDDGPGPVVDFLKEHKYDRGTIGLVGYSASVVSTGDIIPAAVSDYFHKELPNANILNATGLVNYLRIIKSPEEISMLEKDNLHPILLEW